MDVLTSIVLASLLIGFISLAGGMFLLKRGFLSEKTTAYLVSFAAGTMLAVSFFDLLPEALEASGGSGDIFIFVLLGIVAFFLLERFVLWFHHHDSTHGVKPASYLILIGDGVHNFIDGVAIAAAFLASPALGVITTLAIAAHEIPQEIADFSILIHGGMKKIQALLFNFLSAMTALLGAVIGFYFLEGLEGAVPVLLAFTAGMFTYIACSDLIPELHKDFTRQRSWTQLIPFISGLALLWFLVRTLEG